MRFRFLVAACALAATLPGPARADYPDQPIRLIVPFTPGGGTDFLSRTVATKLGESEQWTVVAENRPGAGGTIGISAAARAIHAGYESETGHADNPPGA